MSQNILRQATVGLALIGGACSVEAPQQTSEVENFPALTVPETSTIVPIDNCMDENPNYGPYDVERSVVAQLGGMVIPSLEIVHIMATPTQENITQLEQSMFDTYGTSIQFPDTPRVESDTDGIAYQPVNLSPEDELYVRQNMLEQTLDAFSLLPAGLIKDAGITQVLFVQDLKVRIDLDREGVQFSDVAGVYRQAENVIMINIFNQSASTSAQLQATIFHEVWHAVDTVMCSPEDIMVDESFTRDSGYLGYGMPPEIVRESLYSLSHERVYSDAHAMENPLEDRAEMANFTFYDRGLILEGDVDYGTELAAKQEEFIRRLEEMTPGIREFLMERTLSLREHGFNEINREDPITAEDSGLNIPTIPQTTTTVG